MQRPLRVRAELVVLVAGLVATGSAAISLHSGAVHAEDAPADATVLLDRVAGAGDVAYRARQIVVYFGRPQSAALLDVHSSPEGRFVRAESGVGVSRIWSRPDLGVVDGAEADLEEVAPPKMLLRPASVLAKYEITIGEAEDHLGTSLLPVTFERRSDSSLVERWWVHESSGVLYRRALYDGRGKLVGMSTVIDMDWGTPALADPIASSDASTRVRQTSATKAPAELPAGYRLWRTYELDVAGTSAEQWVYGDGLHALSIFRTDGAMRAPNGFTRRGDVWTGPGPGTWAWQGGGDTWLAVAEEPGLDPERLLESFPRGGPSVAARLGSVWARLFGAVGGLFD